MEKLQVKICLGTTCYVMGSSGLENLEELLTPEMRERVEVTGSNCLGFCKDRKYGQAPYVTVGDRVIPQATSSMVIEVIAEILGA